MNDAIRDWVTNVDHTFYLIGSVAGMHPYPTMVRDFQTVIGTECLLQMPVALQRLGMATQHPDVVIACTTDDEHAFYQLRRVEGIIPALEACHVVAHAVKLAATLPRDQTILINLSGRGDKDMDTVMARANAMGESS